jgi:predicted AAA+ superfamily ATPase
MYLRKLDLAKIINENSVLLLGPRATGKSYLMKTTLKADLMINLLSHQEFARFSSNPSLLSEMCSSLKQKSIVVIDEIQKIPELLNEVHLLIEEKNLRFVLTGSSARKLKKGGANLLAGRAWTREFYPLTSDEIGEKFNLIRYLNRGGLPRSYDSTDFESELESYIGTYLKEEVQAEALTRNLPAFAKFLEVMAIQSGEELFLEGIANDTGIKAKTISNYIEILEDTLLGFTVPAFQETKKRKAISRSKFYLFDVGVSGFLSGRVVKDTKSDSFGRALEQMIAQELRAYISYERKRLPLQYWRSVSQQEVDFVVGKKIAIEVKATDRVSSFDLKNLKALREENLVEQFMLISNDEKSREIEGIQLVSIQDFLTKLWDGKLF